MGWVFVDTICCDFFVFREEAQGLRSLLQDERGFPLFFGCLSSLSAGTGEIFATGFEELAACAAQKETMNQMVSQQPIQFPAAV